MAIATSEELEHAAELTVVETYLYFNVLLIGKTGMGKSTTGNKLIRSVIDPAAWVYKTRSVNDNYYL